MKIIFVLLVAVTGLCYGAYGQVSGPVRFEGCGGKVVENNYIYDGKILYAIGDQYGSAPFGKIVFTPEEGGRPWIFSWTYNGVSQTVPANDSLSLEVDMPGSGFYTFRAEKDGVASHSAPEFHVFFDHVPEFSIHLSDILNCKTISIDAITDFAIPFYPYQGQDFYGSKRVGYLVSGRETPIFFEDYTLALKERENAVAVNSEDQEISVTITDKFGIEWTSKPDYYTSVIPKAVAELEYGNQVDIVGEVNEEMGQAPLEVRFISSGSENADSYEWLLYKDTADIADLAPDLLDSLLDGQIRTTPEFLYTYEHTGRYKVRLIAISDKGNRCADTTQALYINVIESLLEVPNVFTPNGDGKNDVFMVKGLSLEDFHAVILNRWGRKVYEWSDPQGGWDGRIHGKYANPGTYYYIVTARGREKQHTPKYVKKGALMLIR